MNANVETDGEYAYWCLAEKSNLDNEKWLNAQEAYMVVLEAENAALRKIIDSLQK